MPKKEQILWRPNHFAFKTKNGKTALSLPSFAIQTCYVLVPKAPIGHIGLYFVTWDFCICLATFEALGLFQVSAVNCRKLPL